MSELVEPDTVSLGQIVQQFVSKLTEENDRVEVDDSIRVIYESYLRKHICYLDIETLKLSEYANPDEPKNPVTLISLYCPVEHRKEAFTFRKDFPKYFKYIHHFHHDPTDTDHEIVIHFFNKEATMLKAFAKHFHRVAPDIQVGWNFEDFDIPYLYGRYSELKIKERELLSVDGYTRTKVIPREEKKKYKSRHGFLNTCSGITIFDMLWGYRRIFKRHSSGEGLDQTTRRHLTGVDGKPYGKLSTKISEEGWYEADFDFETCTGPFLTFIEYGFLDCLLLDHLEKKCPVLLPMHFICCFFGIDWEHLHQASVILDTSFMYFKPADVWLPTKIQGEDIDLEGGAVKTPLAGFHWGLTVVLDFSRQYTNAIRAANLGVDTYIPPELHDQYENDDVVKLGNGEWYRKDKISFVSNMVTIAFKFRDTIESIRDGYEKGTDIYEAWTAIRQMVKEIINAIYGMATNKYTRQFHGPSAKSITFLGRELLGHNQRFVRKINAYLKSHGFKGGDVVYDMAVVKNTYSDTDSVFLWTNIKNKHDVEKLGYFITKTLNKSYLDFCKQWNMFPQYTKVSFESILENIFFPKAEKKKEEEKNAGTKKNYACYKLWDDGKWIMKAIDDGTKVESKIFVWKGMIGKKSNAPLISKDLQENLLKMGCDGQRKDKVLPFLRGIVDTSMDCMRRQVCPGKECGGRDFLVSRDDGATWKEYRTESKILDVDTDVVYCKKCQGVFKARELLYDMEKLAKVGVPHNFGRDLDMYTGDAAKHAAIRAARYIRTSLNIPLRSDETIMYYYVDRVYDGKYTDTDVMAINPENPRFPPEFDIDIDKMLKNIVFSKIKHIIPFLSISWKEIIDPTRKKA